MQSGFKLSQKMNASKTTLLPTLLLVNERSNQNQGLKRVEFGNHSHLKRKIIRTEDSSNFYNSNWKDGHN
jgi:hypothetical protein